MILIDILSGNPRPLPYIYIYICVCVCVRACVVLYYIYSIYVNIHVTTYIYICAYVYIYIYIWNSPWKSSLRTGSIHYLSLSLSFSPSLHRLQTGALYRGYQNWETGLLSWCFWQYIMRQRFSLLHLFLLFYCYYQNSNITVINMTAIKCHQKPPSLSIMMLSLDMCLNVMWL